MKPLKYFSKIFLIYLILCVQYVALGQSEYDYEPPIEYAPYVVVGVDTIPMLYLREVTVYENLSPAQRRRLNRIAKRQERRDARDEAAFARLRYNVYKVYPYANTAAYLLKDVNIKLSKMPNEEARKKYLKSLEKELNKRFKGELEEFTISQGVVLVKLINRQTGHSCFDIIKEIKGGFNATVWQGVALVFGNNLRREYDPYDRDKDIEFIVNEIEQNIKSRQASKKS